jgi:sigma-B regulation protein RsbU (phosphoserine phosphatase)
MFGYHWLDPEHLILYLLDVSGHGVGSSLLAVSVANMLSGGSLPNADFRDPGQVLSRLNDIFQMDRQNGKYFTIWYGVFRKPDRTLRYGNAGHPPALLYTRPGAGHAPFRRLEAVDPVIGMMPPEMPFETCSVTLSPDARLLVYSDGVFEIERPDGSMWKLSDFLDFLATFPLEDKELPERLYRAICDLRGSDALADDFSLIDARL